MIAKDIREMTDAEIEVAFEDTNKEMFNLRLQQTLGQIERPHRIKEIRRDIARLTMVKTERVKAAAETAEQEA